MSVLRTILFALSVCCVMVGTDPGSAYAQRDLKDIPVPDPEMERATFRLPEGFEVNLFAADPMIAKPIQMNFDEDGRLWIVSSEVYPQIAPGKEATDRVLVLEDQNQDGVSDATHVFAGGLLIPTGVAPGDGGVYVANSTELLHFADTNGDLKADSKRVVLSGFGTEDTHHILHTLRWGYDGYLYFNQSIYIHSHLETPWGVRRLNAGGIWQYRPETQELGVFLRGLVNTWGHHFDRFGQSFATDGAGGEGINYVIPGAYYLTAADAARILPGLNPGSPKHCGLELVETPQLPPDWQGNAITNDFRGHRVVRFVLTEEGAGYVSREQQEVIASDHVAFRPIDVKQGPDGAIYIADWYNPIIQHGEVDFRDDRRDHTHGRIWRVRWTGAKSNGWKPLSQRKNGELFELLRSADGFQRQGAKQILRQRGQDIVPELLSWLKTAKLSDEERDSVRLEVLWCIQAARLTDRGLLTSLLESTDGRIRAAALRVLSHWKYQIPDSHALITKHVEDSHPRARLEAIRAISFSPLDDSERQTALSSDDSVERYRDVSALSVSASDAATSDNLAAAVAQFDQPASIDAALSALRLPMDRFLDYGLWLTTRELSRTWIPAWKNGTITLNNDEDRILFAFNAVGTGAPVDLLLDRIYTAQISADQRGRLVSLMSASATADQFGRMVQLAAEHQDAPALRIIRDATEQRRMIPTLKGDELQSFLQSNDALLRQLALVAGGQWKLASVSSMLQQILRDSSADESLRAAAVRGAAAGGDSELLKTLSELAADRSEASRTLRRLAVIELVRRRTEDAASLAGELLVEMKAEDSVSDLAEAFLSHRDGDSLMMTSLRTATSNARSIDSHVARGLLRTLRESGRTSAELETMIRTMGQISGRRMLTPEQKQSLLASVAASGNASEGERIYRSEQLGCIKCHSIAGAGGQVGPDMVSLGASAQPDYLLDSLLEPNAKVKENYHTTVIVTTEGKVLSGIQIQKSKEETRLRLADNSVVTIPAADIEETANGVSLMPEGLVDALTDAEIVSLVRFLSELGRTSDFTVSRNRYVRNWQVMQATPEAAHLLRRHRYSIAASDDPAFVWKPAVSTVAGSLPLTDIPVAAVRQKSGEKTTGSGFVRAGVQVTSPGKIGFRVNSAEGLELRVGDRPIDLGTEFTVELTPGVHRLTFIVDLMQRKQPIQLELVDLADGGTAEFQN